MNESSSFASVKCLELRYSTVNLFPVCLPESCQSEISLTQIQGTDLRRGLRTCLRSRGMAVPPPRRKSLCSLTPLSPSLEISALNIAGLLLYRRSLYACVVGLLTSLDSPFVWFHGMCVTPLVFVSCKVPSSAPQSCTAHSNPGCLLGPAHSVCLEKIQPLGELALCCLSSVLCLVKWLYFSFSVSCLSPASFLLRQN